MWTPDRLGEIAATEHRIELTDGRKLIRSMPCRQGFATRTIHTLMKVHTQLSTAPKLRTPQAPRAHTVPTYQDPIDVPTIVSGLDPKRTLLSPFNDVVSYEAYQLDSTTGHVRERKSRNPPIEDTTMRIVSYVAPVRRKETDFVTHVFSQLREGLNALGVAEAAAVRMLAFLLGGEAKSFYDSVAITGTRSRNTNRTYT